MVGCGSCRLDIGVRSTQPGQLVLGIEFDGPMHVACAAAARDL